MINFKNLIIGLLLAIAFLPLEAQQLAFPGAEGCGRFTTGGRGGAVYVVDKLTDHLTSPEIGSLRWAINKSGPRTIVFAVSGTIQLKGRLTVKYGDLTIAGQTAPGDGICIKDYVVQNDANNVIYRFLRFRCGKDAFLDDSQDSFWGRGKKNIIIDHCSMTWSIDEASSFYDNENFTMQWCLVAESLYNSGHSKGNHGYGGIWGGMGASFHHNLIANHTSRNPRFCGARYHSSTKETEIVDFRNNVISNWGFNSVYGGEMGQYNMINNCYKAGPATSSSKRNRIVEVSTSDSHWYVDGNYVEGYPAITADNWAGGVQGVYPGKPEVRATIPYEVEPVVTHSPLQAYELVVQYAGAVLPIRDAVDRRIAETALTGTCNYGGTYGAASGIVDNQNDVGGWPLLNSLPAPADSDADGMPDAWETANSLNPNSATDRNTVDTDGYTMLEKYLNSLVPEMKSTTSIFLNTSVQGDGSIATSLNKATYTNTDVVTLTATPATDYVFDHWEGSLSGNTNPIDVTMTESVDAKAVFITTKRKLTLKTIGVGTITVSPQAQLYDPNTMLTITATADDSWEFVSWSGGSTSTEATITLTIIDDINLTARFSSSPQSTLTVQGETACVMSGAEANNHTGYNGGGFLDTDNVLGASAEWYISALQATEVNLSIRYSNGSTNDRPLKLVINNAEQAANISCPPTTDYDTWSDVSVTASLGAGINSLRLVATTSSGAANIDQILLSAQSNVLAVENCANAPEEVLAPTSLNVLISETTATLLWSDKATNETGYVVERKTGTGNFEVIATLAAARSSYSDTELQAGETYTYRVKAIAGLQSSNYSAEVSKTLATTGMADANSIQANMTIYPNPFDSYANLQLALVKSGNVAVTLIDVLGRRTVILPTSYLDAGLHTQRIERGNLAKGIYVVECLYDGQQIMQRIVIQ